MPESLPASLFDKLWNAHVVVPQSETTPAILYIDLHLVHEVTSPQGFALLREKGIGVRRPERTLATLDHSTPTLPPAADGQRPYITEQAHRQGAGSRTLLASPETAAACAVMGRVAGVKDLDAAESDSAQEVA